MKSILTLFCAALFITQTVYATNRILQSSGTGGAYTSISVAIAAAASGDRIIIYPGFYIENVTVNKNNLFFVTALQGSNYSIQGTLTFTGAGNNFLNCSLNGNVIDNGNTNRLAGCNIYGYISCYPGEMAYFDHDSINQSPNIYAPGIAISRGRVIGCVISTYYGIQTQSSNTTTNDSLVIVGNKIILNGANGAFNIHSPQQFLYIANNLINFVTISSSEIGYFLELDSIKSSTSINNAIVNNTFLVTGSGGLYHGGFIMSNSSSNLVIENNIINTNGPPAVLNNGAIPFVFRYNQSRNSFSGLDGTNITTNSNVIDPNSGILSSGTAIDGGDPDPAYMDLDLSRNDVGCYGGSYSLANFTTADYGARTLFMKAPRVVMTNQSFAISGDGLAR